MRRVLVLGASGMLGSMVVDVLARDPDIAITATVRDSRLRVVGEGLLPGVEWVVFDAAAWDGGSPLPGLRVQAWVINCIGITKPLIRDDHPAEVERAIRINTLLPYLLGAAIRGVGGRVIQIATDCVFSGRRGSYAERDEHDALDVYGKTKSLGETPQPGMYHLRSSIIGPEPKEHKFLLEWFLRQPRGAQVRGFVNHRWNGVSTLHFARICYGVVKADRELPNLQHVVPTGTVSKAEMLHIFAAVYGRGDIEILENDAPQAVDRTLVTTAPATNQGLWRQAGYNAPPTVAEMIAELGRFDYRFGGLVTTARPAGP